MTYARILLLFVICTMTFIVNGQDEDLSRKYKKLLEKSEEYAKKSDYKKAIKQLDKILSQYPDFAEGYIRKGSYLYNTDDLASSAKALEKGLQLDPSSYPKAYYSLGVVYQRLERYKDAAQKIETYLSLQQGGRLRTRAQNVLEQCTVAADLVANPVPFEPHLLPYPINTKHLEYTPLPSVDGEQIVFTRRVGGQEDFYVASKTDTSYSVSPIAELNTPYNEGAHTLSADGNTMIYTACDYGGRIRGCDLYITNRQDGVWQKPRRMGNAINSNAWDAQPSLSSDGKLLYFSSNRDGGVGGRDIWYSRYHDKKGWSVAKPLPKGINTSGNEESPFIHADGVTLYYRSDGFVGMGDYDIYYTRYHRDKGGWTKPKNIGYPINTKGDDGALTISLDGSRAYFASDRDSRDGKQPNLDIYTFELYEEARPQPMTFVKAIVRDRASGKPLDASISLIDYVASDTLHSNIIAREGTLVLPVPAYGSYACFVKKEGYIYRSERFETDTVTTALEPYIVHIDLEAMPAPSVVVKPSEAPKPIILKNIFFASGSAELKEASAAELDMLYQLLLSDSSITATIVGHTDDVGSDADNLKLSLARARAVVSSLIGMGIDASRLQAEGKGESQPIADNDSETGRATNRRTECHLKRN